MQPTVFLSRICCAVLLLGSMSAHAAKTTPSATSGGAGAAQCRPAWPAQAQGNSKGYPNPAPMRVALSLDPSGRFIGAQLVSSSGYADLDAALLAALARCDFASVPKGATPQKWLVVAYSWPYNVRQEPALIKLPLAR